MCEIKFFILLQICRFYYLSSIKSSVTSEIRKMLHGFTSMPSSLIVLFHPLLKFLSDQNSVFKNGLFPFQIFQYLGHKGFCINQMVVKICQQIILSFFEFSFRIKALLLIEELYIQFFINC